MNLRDYQERGAQFQRDVPKGWLSLDQGLGKTAPTLVTFEAPGVALIPAFLEPNWLREIAMWRPDLSVCRLSQTKAWTPGFDLYLSSYDQLVRNDGVPHGIRTLVLDESHYIKSPKAKRTKAIIKHIRAIDRVNLLSGTPMLARPIDLWTGAYALGITRLGWRDWGFRYCAGKLGTWGGYDFRGASNLGELRELIAPYVFRLTKAEVGGLPPKMRRIVALNGPEDRRERDYEVGAILRNPNPVAFIGLSEVMHEHGKRKVDASLEYLHGILESENQIVVYAHHEAVLKALRFGFDHKGYSVQLVTGKTPPLERDSLVQSFQRGDFRVLLGSVGSMGVGHNITAARYCAFVEATWSRSVNVQAEDRLHRIGQTLPVQVDYLVVDRSLDARVLDVCMGKEQVSDTVLGDSERLFEALL